MSFAIDSASRATVFAAAILLLIAFAGSPYEASAAGSVLEGNHPAEAQDIASGGATLAQSRQLRMTIRLALRGRAEMDRLLAAQQDSSSPEYHRWLTPNEFASRFGPTEADVARVSNFLKRQGFIVTSADAARRAIVFSGTAANAERAFGVKIAADGEAYANLGDPTIPAEVAGLVDSIGGLDNTLHSAPMARRISTDAAPAVAVNGVGPAFGPPDIYTFYNENGLLDLNIDGDVPGCLGIVEDSNVDRTAADAFNAHFGLPAFTTGNFAIDLVDGTDPGQNSDELEAMVDINYSHAAAPGSKLKVYVGDQNNSQTGNAILDGLLTAIDDNACSAIAVSFGFCGGSNKFYKALDGFLAQAALQGQSIFIASGDEGSAGLIFKKKAAGCVPGKTPHVSELAASPNVTAIGGTQFSADFNMSDDDVGSVAESAWNDGFGASGGGKSKVFKKPAFQAGVIPKDKKRDIPDISLAASPAAPAFFFGSSGAFPVKVGCCVGGTSIGAPIYAGLSQLLTQVNGSRVGNINARLYQLGAMNDPADTGIRDVTVGSNAFNGAKGFAATPGYDKATGWGSADFGLFVPAFVNP